MSLQKQQDFLARLYTDVSLRQNFLSAPAKIGADNDLSESEIIEIAEIMPEELNFFAANYVFKVVPVVVKIKYAVNQKNESPAAKRPPLGASI